MRELFITISLVAAVQALILSLALIIRKNNRHANIYLSLYLFFGMIDLIELYLATRGFICSYPYQLSIIPYSYVFGPSMYLYIAVLTEQFTFISKKFLLLYVPFGLVLLINIILYNNSIIPDDIKYNITFTAAGFFYELILYSISFIILFRYKRKMKDHISRNDSLKLSFILFVLAVLIFVVFFIFLSYLNGHIRIDYKVPDIIALLVSIGLLFSIAFFALVQPETFNRIDLIDNAKTKMCGSTTPKYEKFRLTEAKEVDIAERLSMYMSKQKPYLEEELTLQHLASRLSLSAHQLSMILNIHFKQNFYNYINSYRIDEVKRRLTDPVYCEYSILKIAFDSGFNSKSTFNSMFKKFTGMSPKEYRVKKS